MNVGNHWGWAAGGKHPVARDFIVLGQDLPIFRAFHDWVEKGYQLSASKGNRRLPSCQFRFWAKGTGKHVLACGLLKDSCDMLGRPYPLLIVGAGFLGGWEERWDLIPLACENTWRQIEYIAAKKHNDIDQLKSALKNIKPPQTTWDNLAQPHGAEGQNGFLDHEETVRKMEQDIERLSGKNDFFFQYEAGRYENHLTLTHLWHHALKSRLKELPRAVFVDGSAEHTYLAAYSRALVPDDFYQLWSFRFEDVGNGLPLTTVEEEVTVQKKIDE